MSKLPPPRMPDAAPGAPGGKCPGCLSLVYDGEEQTTDGDRAWHTVCALATLRAVASRQGRPRPRPGQQPARTLLAPAADPAPGLVCGSCRSYPCAPGCSLAAAGAVRLYRDPPQVQRVSALDALAAGRTHYRASPAPSAGKLAQWAEDNRIGGAVLAAFRRSIECKSPMLAVPSEGGAVLGWRCAVCGTTATADGRTEYGPRFDLAGGRGWAEPGHERSLEGLIAHAQAAGDV